MNGTRTLALSCGLRADDNAWRIFVLLWTVPPCAFLLQAAPHEQRLAINESGNQSWPPCWHVAASLLGVFHVLAATASSHIGSKNAMTDAIVCGGGYAGYWAYNGIQA
jgi:hypothetical protein